MTQRHATEKPRERKAAIYLEKIGCFISGQNKKLKKFWNKQREKRAQNWQMTEWPRHMTAGPIYLPQRCKSRAQSSAKGWREVKKGVWGRVGSHGDRKVSELPCLLRGRSRKTTVQRSSGSGRCGCAVFILATRGQGDQGRWQGQWGRVPRVTERQRHTRTHTPEDFVSITKTSRGKRAEMVWGFYSAPWLCHFWLVAISSQIYRLVDWINVIFARTQWRFNLLKLNKWHHLHNDLDQFALDCRYIVKKY